ncbi:equilibrative nucleoside transporter 4-like [Sinocyclocheilus grahami]|uniref:equilibrative nucleoside transporter 4-like n=1 Tax=Sinocyclocheilus grahami TaxID=75366 RepID=UPI0007AD3860|nr:PREDICTED: equilibrative nucleoside transporter 4-like [Sinocyclocheilus grahami]
MGSKGVERRKQATPGQTPEGNVVMSFSFESYQLEEEDCQVKDISDKGVLALSEPAFEEPIPDDRYHRIYFAMLLAGVGFLLPYNSFITDVDYLHHKFEGTPLYLWTPYFS